MSPPMVDVRWTIHADLAEVGPLMLEAARLLEAQGVCGSALFTAQLALEEILTNCVRHACHHDRSREVRVSLAMDGEGVTIVVEDQGRPFDPLGQAPVPDLTAPLEARVPGGLGLHLVRSMVDHWDYARDGLTNRVSMHVHATPAPAAA